MDNLDNHIKDYLKRLEELRDDKRLVDFTITVDGLVMEAHKLVLAANSDYFKAMFTHDLIERRESNVNLEGLESSAVRAILDYCYTFQINLTENNVADILIAASRLQVKRVQDLCIEFAESRISESNCFGWASISNRCNLEGLESTALNYCLEHFSKAASAQEFSYVDESFLIRVISDDKLNVRDELEVFQAIIRWVEFDLNTRIEKLESLLKNVRFPSIEPVKLVKLAECDLVKQSPACLDLIDKAKNYILLECHPDLQAQYMSCMNPKPRKFSDRMQRLYAVGGWIDEFKSIATAEVYNPGLNSWTDIPPMTHKRCGVGLVALNDSIYAVGGHDGQYYLSSVERYDTIKEKWFKDVAPMPTVGTSVGVVSLNGYIYAIGGQISSGASHQVERYDPVKNVWTNCARLITPRLGLGVAVDKQFIYIMGGADGGAVLDSVLRYDSKNNIWSKVASMNVARKHLGSCSCRGKIYAVGGRNQKGIQLDSAEVYDPNLDVWSFIRPMQKERCGLGLVEIAGKIYAVGGQNQDARLNSVEAYDIDSDTWTWRAPMRQERLGGGMTVHPICKVRC